MQKTYNKIIATILTVFLSMSNILIQPVFATSYQNTKCDLYAQKASETVTIEGIDYTYHYFYEGENRVITITNNRDNSTDKIVYNTKSNITYINNDAQPIASWQTLSKESNYVSWAKGTTVAVVAGAIAVALSGLGAAGVIAAMGTTALGVLAAAAIGGTVNLELQWYYAPPAATQYRYLWSFKASTGDRYGTYVSHFNP